MMRNYQKYAQKKYNYIVVDEAHHAVSPVLKRVIQYFTPDFLIGLTATDQRPDKKKLETIFGNYKTGLSLVDAMKKKIVAIMMMAVLALSTAACGADGGNNGGGTQAGNKRGRHFYLNCRKQG